MYFTIFIFQMYSGTPQRKQIYLAASDYFSDFTHVELSNSQLT